MSHCFLGRAPYRNGFRLRAAAAGIKAAVLYKWIQENGEGRPLRFLFQVQKSMILFFAAWRFLPAF